MWIWILWREDIEYSEQLLFELIFSEKWFTFPNWVTVQSFWNNKEKFEEYIKKINWYKEKLIVWVNWGIWNNIMELSWKSILEINGYILNEFTNLIYDIKRLTFNVLENNELINSSKNLLDYSESISKYRKKIEEITTNPVCLRISSYDNSNVKHSWTIYDRVIFKPVSINYKGTWIMSLLNELKMDIWCTWIFIVDSLWKMYWNMWNIDEKAMKMWINRQKSQRVSQKKSTISRTALPYYAEWPDTKSFSIWHNKWKVASLIRIPIDCNWILYDMKIFYEKPVYLNNSEVPIALEYAKILEKQLVNWTEELKELIIEI